MAGRGRGRGRGRGGSANRNFFQQELGLGRGEPLLIQREPPPLFPDVDHIHPVPLPTGEEYDYMVTVTQNFRRTAQSHPMFAAYTKKNRDVERYSDKYQRQDLADTWEPDYSRLPDELRPSPPPQRKQKARTMKTKIVPSLVARKRSHPEPTAVENGITEAAEAEEEADALVRKTTQKPVAEQDEEPTEAVVEDDEYAEEEEELEEEELEEELEEDEGDYAKSYFENGENYEEDGEESEETY